MKNMKTNFISIIFLIFFSINLSALEMGSDQEYPENQEETAKAIATKISLFATLSCHTLPEWESLVNNIEKTWLVLLHNKQIKLEDNLKKINIKTIKKLKQKIINLIKIINSEFLEAIDKSREFKGDLTDEHHEQFWQFIADKKVNGVTVFDYYDMLHDVKEKEDFSESLLSKNKLEQKNLIDLYIYSKNLEKLVQSRWAETVAEAGCYLLMGLTIYLLYEAHKNFSQANIGLAMFFFSSAATTAFLNFIFLNRYRASSARYDNKFEKTKWFNPFELELTLFKDLPLMDRVRRYILADRVYYLEFFENHVREILN